MRGELVPACLITELELDGNDPVLLLVLLTITFPLIINPSIRIPSSRRSLFLLLELHRHLNIVCPTLCITSQTDDRSEPHPSS